MQNRAAGISVAGSPLGDSRHVCAFFGSDDEESRVLLPFMKDGLDRGERVIHVVKPRQRDEQLRRLSVAGVDAIAAQQRGQLELRTDTDTYLPDGRFDQDRMLTVFARFAGGDARRGFPRSRIVCQMDWAAGDSALIDDVIEFESRVNDLWRRHDDAVVCTYRLAQLGGDAVIDILRTHPMVIVGGILVRNSFFVPPEQFVPAFRERRAARGARRPPVT